MEKSIQVFLIKSKIIKLLAEMLEDKESPIEKKTILEFSKYLFKLLDM